MPFEPSNTREHKLIDLNLFSGSTDAFRTAVGGYWKIETEEPTGPNSEEQNNISFQDYKPRHPLFPYFAEIRTNSSLKETVSEEILITNKRFPVRVYGDGESVRDDIYWKALFMGGQFGREEIKPAYNENVYGYHYFETSLSYPKRDAAVIEGNSIGDQIQISNDYNHYLSEYEKYIGALDSELLIPNYYIISDLQSIENIEDINENTYNSDIINFVTLEDNYTTINTVMESAVGSYLALRLGAPAENSTNLIEGYLPKFFVQNPLSASTITAVKNNLQNIILDELALNKLYHGDQILKYKENFPFHMKINFPLDKSDASPPITPFADFITNNKHTARFLKTLKEVFTGELSNLPPVETAYASNMSYLSSSEGSAVDYNVETTENKNYRYVDFIRMLAHDYNNFISTTDNCYFVGDKNMYRDAVFDSNGAYRYLNSVSAVNTMNDVIDYVNNEANFSIDSLEDFLFTNNSCYNETVAYRVQKVGGAPTGDARTQETLQNYWFANTKDLDDFNFIDTQVKYNKDYTYHVYKYVIVVGARYKFSDLRLTQGISFDNYDSTTQKYGLEFYDPLTNEKVEQLYNVGESSFESLSSFGSLVQESSKYPYLADFYLNYEPCVFVYEVPIYSKTLKILDNPANGTNIFPYQHLDNSQKIGFGLYYDEFGMKKFPKTINSTDEKLKQDYMNAKDLLSESFISDSSISRPKYMQIYRLEEAPTSYSDFDNNLLNTLNLGVPNSDDTYTVDFFDNQIRTNKKYYYLFRTLNEQRMIGHTSEIYETELVSDGGYLYALFNVYHEEDLEKNIFVSPSRNLRKLIQLQPNMSQLALNTDLVDFTQEASSQLENLKIGSADDLIWDKKFKVRLTSKKTGKKIDLNITYKLRSS